MSRERLIVITCQVPPTKHNQSPMTTCVRTSPITRGSLTVIVGPSEVAAWRTSASGMAGVPA